MRDLHIVDKLFDVSITSSYHLSVLLDRSSLQYAILDTVRGKFLLFKTVSFGEILSDDALYQRLDKLIHTEPYLSRNYKKLSACVATQKQTLVPAPMFGLTEMDRYKKLFGHENEPESLLENYLKDLDSYIVFSLPERLINLMEDRLDAPQIFHQMNPLIQSALVHAKNQKNLVYGCVYSQFIDVVVVQDRQLKLANSFPYRSAKDLVFYLLYVLDQFQLSGESTPLRLAGDVDDQSEVFQLLRQYIREITWQGFNRSYNYSVGFNEIVQHRYVNLIDLFGCE